MDINSWDFLYDTQVWKTVDNIDVIDSWDYAYDTHTTPGNTESDSTRADYGLFGTHSSTYQCDYTALN